MPTIYLSRLEGSTVVCGCACPCEDVTTAYVVSIDADTYNLSLSGDCTWYLDTGPCGPPAPGDTIEMILFGNTCGWFLTIQYVGIWSMTGVGPTNQTTPVGSYTFGYEVNCDLSASSVSVA